MSNSGKDEYTRGVITLAEARDRVEADVTATPLGIDSPGGVVSNESGKAPATVKIMDRLREKGMLVPDSILGPEIRSEYRRVKRPLLSNAFGKSASLVDQGNLIMVTSAVPGEGKTFTSVNLALALAQERDHTVLLVDCDVTKQGMSRLLGVEKLRPDFTDLLSSENMPISDALLRTDVPGLVLLPAGKPHEYITEMIASQRMEQLANEFATRYSDRIVVLDAPPLLSTPEAQVLTGLVGQIVYVIEAGKTPYAIVQDALEMLPRDKAIGMVLNKSESISNRGGYYYNYYAAYGEDKSDREKPK
jgi:exopolysaccharide/PEP-CTERM locus tyrosine autokinase